MQTVFLLEIREPANIINLFIISYLNFSCIHFPISLPDLQSLHIDQTGHVPGSLTDCLQSRFTGQIGPYFGQIKVSFLLITILILKKFDRYLTVVP